MEDHLALGRALRFERSVRRAASDRRKRFEWGTAIYNTRAPLVIDVNTLEFTRPDRALTPVRLDAVAERLQGALEHRQALFEDAIPARRLARGLVGRGWQSRRYVVMVHRGPQAQSGEARAVDLSPADYRRAHEVFIRGEPYGADKETVEQLLLVADMVATRIPTRYFGAGPRGRAVATCALFSRGRSAQIEDVGTFERYRNQGFGRAVVESATAAAYEAGHRFLFLVADAKDWPRHLYARLGFRPVGTYPVFTVTGHVDFRH